MSVETQLLSGLLLDFDDWLHPDVLELQPEQFDSPGTGEIFAAIRQLFRRGLPVDLGSVRSALEANGGPPEAWPDVLAEAETPAPASMPELARLIRESWARRRLNVVLERARAQLKTSTADEAVQAVQAALDEVVFGETPRAHLLGEELRSLVERLRERKPVEVDLDTGLAELDRVTYGLRPGWLWYIAARPGMGKSALGLQIAIRAAGRDRQVLFFSAEMNVESLAFRAMAHSAGIELGDIMEGQLTDYALQSAEYWSDLLEGKPLFVYDDCPTVEQIATRCRLHRSEHGLDLVVVDYLQLLRPTHRAMPRHEQVAHMSRELKQLAKLLDVPVIVLAQLSRRAEDRTSKRPTLADMKESGQTEQDADVVVFPWRDESKSDRRMDIGELIVAKNRHGPTAKIGVAFTKPNQVFRLLADEQKTQRSIAWQRGGSQ